jgi:hypothetical protein
MSLTRTNVRLGLFLVGVAALIASMTLGPSPSWSIPCKTIAEGPVNQGVVFYGVKCNYPACYCRRRICAGKGPQTWCERLKMKFH